MKKILIKILLLTLVFELSLIASSYEWKASVDKSSVYTDEAIYLEYRCEFSDRGELYVIDFNPVISDENVTIKLLSETTKIINSKRVNIYEYIAFVHKAGVHKFDFEMLMKKTNQDSIENTVIGRDNGEYEEFTIRYLRQKTLEVSVKDSHNTTVGELKVDINAGSEKVKAYEPYNLEVRLEGIANFYDIKPISFNIEGVKIFSQKPIQNTLLTKNGYKGSWSQKFAFVSDKNFEIPAFKFTYFDLKREEIVAFTSDKKEILVEKKYTKEELLDEDESFTFNYDYIYYLLSFIAGFLISKIKFKRVARLSSKEEQFKNKIEGLNSLDELLFTLILEDAHRYKTVIAKIESGELTSLKEVKSLIFRKKLG